MSGDYGEIESALARLKPAPARPLSVARLLPKTSGRPGWLAAAAVFLAALLTGWWTGRPAPLTEGRVLSVPAGESLSLTLPDGSRLTFSGGAEAVLGPGRGRGEILSLRGGVLRCEVVHAAGEFRISTPLGDVVDRGTVFTVKVQPHEKEEAVMTKNRKRSVVGAAVVTVGVVVGWVEFRQGASEAAVPVRAGQTLLLEAGKAPVVASVTEKAPEPAAVPEKTAVEKRLEEIDATLQAGQSGKVGQEGINDETKRRVEATQMRCISNLKQLGFSLFIFEDREGRLPDTLDALLTAGDMPEKVACPCRDNGRYVYLPVSPNIEKLISNPSLWIRTYEDAPNALGKRAVGFADGSVQAMDEPRFQALLAAQQQMMGK